MIQQYGQEALKQIYQEGIREVKELIIDPDRIHVVNLGKPKAGKTTLAATAPTPSLFLDVNYGTVSIANFEGIKYVRIFPYGIQDINGNWIFYQKQDWENTSPNERKEQVGTKLLHDLLVMAIQSGEYKTIVLDDETGLYRLCQNCIPIPMSYKRNKFVENTMGWFGDVLAYRNKLLTILDMHRGNVIWNCHTKPVYDDRGKEIGITMAITGQGSTLVPASMDEVWYTERVGNKVTVYTENELCESLGSRYHLPQKIEYASFPAIQQILRKQAGALNTKTGDKNENVIQDKLNNFLSSIRK